MGFGGINPYQNNIHINRYVICIDNYELAYTIGIKSSPLYQLYCPGYFIGGEDDGEYDGEGDGEGEGEVGEQQAWYSLGSSGLGPGSISIMAERMGIKGKQWAIDSQ